MAKIQSLSRRAPRPSKATAREPSILQGGFVGTLNERLYLFVTDGRSILRFPVGGRRDLAEGYIPREALLHIERDGAEFHGDARELRIGSTHSFRDGKGRVRTGEPRARYSRTEPVWDLDRVRSFPTVEEMWPPPAKQKLVIGVDTVLLRRLAMAMGNDRVRIEIPLSGELPGELLLTGPGAPDGVAAVMEQISVVRDG